MGSRPTPTPARTASRSMISEDKRRMGSTATRDRPSLPIKSCPKSSGTLRRNVPRAAGLSPGLHYRPGIGAGDSAGHGGPMFDNVIFPLLLRNVYADKNRQEAIVKDSSLN